MQDDRLEARSGKAAIRTQIEENLRRVYEAALNEPVPDRFADLLQQLRQKQGEGGK